MHTTLISEANFQFMEDTYVKAVSEPFRSYIIYFASHKISLKFIWITVKTYGFGFFSLNFPPFFFFGIMILKTT